MVDHYTDAEDREPAVQVAGRLVGMIVFLAGIVMLVLAFTLAYQAFHNPDMIIPPGTLTSTTATVPSAVYGLVLLRLVLLFAMGYIGSLIAARGAQLFFSARREARRVITGD